MQPITFCNRCRGMKVGWNARYILHCVMCDAIISKSFRFCVLIVLFSSLFFVFPITIGGPVDADFSGSEASILPGMPAAPPRDLSAIEKLLKQHGAQKNQVSRVARAIVASSKKHRMDARLIASIVIVESRANPYAVSEADSMGIMQIHLNTWAEVVDREDVNLFRVEDNVEFGVKILRGYIAASGLWEGVARYKGFTGETESRQAAEEYVRKVQEIYGLVPSGTVS